MAPGTTGFMTSPVPHHATGNGLEFLFDVLSTREAATYLGLSEAVLRAEAVAGRLRGQPADGDWRFLRLALAQWLLSGPHSEPQSQPPAGEGTTSKWDRERTAFRSLLPDLLKTHLGQYVAIHDGRVVEAGTDKVTVARTAYEKHGYQPIFVALVTDAPPRVVHIGGTPIGTPEME